MLLEHDGQAPNIDPTCRIAPNATICGQVTIGPYTSVGFGAVLTAESGSIAIGANCLIMDSAVIRGIRRNPVTLGDNVLVGPRAYLTGCTVGDNAFIATGATVFDGARTGERAEVRVNGIVHLRTVLPADSVVPLSWIAIGDPVRSCPLRSTRKSGPSRRRSTFRDMSLAWIDRQRARLSCRRSCRAMPRPCFATRTTRHSLEHRSRPTVVTPTA